MSSMTLQQTRFSAVGSIRHFKETLFRLILAWDDRRVRNHLERVEAQLRMIDTSTWPESLRNARLQNLARLHAYWLRNQFPRNHQGVGLWAPCFIDSDGRACAVAQLVIDSGETGLAPIPLR